jgi:hypothetical protein
MQQARTSLELRVYCTLCNCDFFPARGSKIRCDNGHQLAKSFPYDSFWNYCCGCDAFYRSNGLEGKEAESNCLCCERAIERRFFCNSCNVAILEAGVVESRRRPVEFSQDGYPFPACPGCLLPPSTTDLLVHDCYSLLVTFLTQREVCPFCNDPITTPAQLDQKSVQVVKTVAAVRRRNNFAFFESIAKRDNSLLNLRTHLPSSRRGWLELAGVLGFILTTLGVLIGLFPSVPAAIVWRINKALKAPLIVSPIECTAHFVLAGERLRLTARVKAPSEDVKFNWTTTAGKLVDQKDQNGQSEVALDTGDIGVLSVPREVTVALTVGDEYGDTALRYERITVMPRRLANNPPVLKIPPRCNCALPEVVAGENVSIYALADDEDQTEPLHYVWQSSSPAAQLMPATSAAGSTVVLNTAGVNPQAAAVPVQIYLTVNDGNGGEVMGDITIMVLPKNPAGPRNESVSNLFPPKRPPKLQAFMADKTTIDAGEPVRLWAFVTDADGDAPIYYDWKASAGNIQNRNETAILTTNGIDPQEVIVFLTVSDGRGGRTSQRLFVKVRNPAVTASPTPVQAKGNDDH